MIGNRLYPASAHLSRTSDTRVTPAKRTISAGEARPVFYRQAARRWPWSGAAVEKRQCGSPPGQVLPDQVFIASKNSALFFESFSLLIRNSSPSTVPIG